MVYDVENESKSTTYIKNQLTKRKNIAIVNIQSGFKI